MNGPDRRLVDKWLTWLCMMPLVLASCGDNGGNQALQADNASQSSKLKLLSPLDSSHSAITNVSAYPDIDGDGKDAFCRSNTSYVGHSGTDFASTWDGMDMGIGILAAHKGVALFSVDGKEDHCTMSPEDSEDCKSPASELRAGLNEGNTFCSDSGNYCDGQPCYFCSSAGNFLVVKDESGSATFYGHLAKGSVTVKAGDLVAQGQLIGRLGSSGFSSGPHLHFEVLDKTLHPVDPWFGSCNPALTEQLWDNQSLMFGRYDVF